MDAFAHVPELREALVPVDQSTMRFSPAVLAERDERVRALGYPADWRQSDATIDRARQALLAQWSGAGDLWVFGYGSLMWDPGFHFAEVRRATVEGYRRRFAMRIEVVTASPEHPGLALTLDHAPERCEGLAFRIPAALVEEEMAILARREFVLFGYRPERTPAATPQGVIDVVVLASDERDPRYVAGLALAEAAAMIASARGPKGGNADYLHALAARLDRLGIVDEEVSRLAALVDEMG